MSIAGSLLQLCKIQKAPQGKDMPFWLPSDIRYTCVHFGNHILTCISAGSQQLGNCVHKLGGTDDSAQVGGWVGGGVKIPVTISEGLPGALALFLNCF